MKKNNHESHSHIHLAISVRDRQDEQQETSTPVLEQLNILRTISPSAAMVNREPLLFCQDLGHKSDFKELYDRQINLVTWSFIVHSVKRVTERQDTDQGLNWSIKHWCQIGAHTALAQITGQTLGNPSIRNINPHAPSLMIGSVSMTPEVHVDGSRVCRNTGHRHVRRASGASSAGS